MSREHRALQIQRRSKDDRAWPLEHLGCFFKFLLQFNVANNLCSLNHLSNKFLQPSEYTDKAALELVRELQGVH